MKIEHWTADQDFGSASWTTVYSITQGLMVDLFGMVFELNTAKAHLRIEYPAVTWEADLDEIKTNYKLTSAGSSTIPRWLYMVSEGVFAIEFPKPVELQGDFAVKLKSHSGTKTLYRGFIVRGLR